MNRAPLFSSCFLEKRADIFYNLFVIIDSKIYLLRLISRREEIILEECKENHIGELVMNERRRRGLSSKAVCSGICSMGVYSKLESGVYAGNVLGGTGRG